MATPKKHTVTDQLLTRLALHREDLERLRTAAALVVHEVDHPETNGDGSDLVLVDDCTEPIVGAGFGEVRDLLTRNGLGHRLCDLAELAGLQRPRQFLMTTWSRIVSRGDVRRDETRDRRMFHALRLLAQDLITGCDALLTKHVQATRPLPTPQIVDLARDTWCNFKQATARLAEEGVAADRRSMRRSAKEGWLVRVYDGRRSAGYTVRSIKGLIQRFEDSAS